MTNSIAPIFSKLQGPDHVVIRRERRTVDGRILCEDVHVYFGDGEPRVVIDREYADSTEGRVEGLVA